MNQRVEFVDRWAREVKNSNGKWKVVHTAFINSQFQKSEEFIGRLSKEKNGAEKIIKLYKIKNKKRDYSLLKKPPKVCFV